ncbi:MAG: DUF4097 family beta strand repeat-containing protein [Gemmatimonadales bacterium]
MLDVFAVVAVMTVTAQETDTTFAVAENARLDLTVMRGDLVIRTWERNEIRIIADHSRSARLAVSGSRSSVRVRVRDGAGGMSNVDLELTIPRSTSLQINGTFLESDIRGVEGEVSVQSVQGDIYVSGGRGRISLHSVQGDIESHGASGRIDLNSSNGDVVIANADGEITIQTLNGEIEMDGIRSSSVDATTVNGEVDYRGTIENNGRYSFTTHNGDITLIISPDVSATFTVTTFSGEFETDFAITLTETSSTGKRLEFTLGGGSARIALSSFGGTIQLERP